MLKALGEDLDDLEHDAEIDAGREKGEKRMGGCEDCPAKLDMGEEAAAQVCAVCERKKCVSPYTARVVDLYGLVDAGCRFDLNDLTLEEWKGVERVKSFFKSLQAKVPGVSDGS